MGKDMMKDLSALEKLDLIRRALITVPLLMLYNATTSAYRAWRRGLAVRSYIRLALIRSFLSGYSARQVIAILPSSIGTYKKWIGRRKNYAAFKQDQVTLSEEITTLSDGESALAWVNGSDTDKKKKVVLFFHGGGYNAPLTPAHLEWVTGYARAGQSVNTSVAVAVLAYSLCPPAQYPTQLRQAAEALNHLLQIGYSPKDIIFGGDSAGGHLTLSLMSHIMHPHHASSIPSIQLGGTPLSAAFLVSPWVTNDMSSRSFRENANVDMIAPSLIRRARSNFFSPQLLEKEISAGEAWALPTKGSDDWWMNLGSVVRDVYITTGKHEMFRDHVVEFANRLIQLLEKANGKAEGNKVSVRFDLLEKEAHDHIVADCYGWNFRGTDLEEGESWKRMRRWFLGVLEEGKGEQPQVSKL